MKPLLLLFLFFLHCRSSLPENDPVFNLCTELYPNRCEIEKTINQCYIELTRYREETLNIIESCFSVSCNQRDRCILAGIQQLPIRSIDITFQTECVTCEFSRRNFCSSYSPLRYQESYAENAVRCLHLNFCEDTVHCLDTVYQN